MEITLGIIIACLASIIIMLIKTINELEDINLYLQDVKRQRRKLMDLIGDGKRCEEVCKHVPPKKGNGLARIVT